MFTTYFGAHATYGALVVSAACCVFGTSSAISGSHLFLLLGLDSITCKIFH